MNFEGVEMQIVMYHSANKPHVPSRHQGISAIRLSRDLPRGVPYFIGFFLLLLIFTDTTGGPFGFEFFNDPYSHCFHISHNTSLRTLDAGQAALL
jgi:hypothetical protein